VPVKITTELLRSWEACWSDEEIISRLGGRESVTPTEVATDEVIKLDDRLWVMCNCLGHLDPTVARLFAIESAELVAHLAGDEEDQVQYLGIMNKMRKIQLEMAPDDRPGARNAIWTIASIAGRDAGKKVEAWDAVRDAVWHAAKDTAKNTAWVAAWEATRSAARAASQAEIGEANDRGGPGQLTASRNTTWSELSEDHARVTAWYAEVRKAIARALKWLR